MSQSPRLSVVPPDADPETSQNKASRPRKATRGQTLARAQEVAQAYVGNTTPLDTAFEAFGRFDGPDGATDAKAIAQAQALVRALLRQPGP